MCDSLKAKRKEKNKKKTTDLQWSFVGAKISFPFVGCVVVIFAVVVVASVCCCCFSLQILFPCFNYYCLLFPQQAVLRDRVDKRSVSSTYRNAKGLEFNQRSPNIHNKIHSNSIKNGSLFLSIFSADTIFTLLCSWCVENSFSLGFYLLFFFRCTFTHTDTHSIVYWFS